MIKMNMKRLLTLCFIVTITFLISSCATFYPNQKYLIGTWKAEKVEKYKMQNPQNPVTAAQGTTKPGTGDTKALVDTARQSSRLEEQIARITQTELRSSLTVNANKTATVETHGKTIHMKWKLKNQGTRLLAKSKETGKEKTYDILHINDTSAVITQNFPFGSLKVTYKKVKK
jgi:hypothetical protein